jgi:hypothetical protein
MFWFGSFANCNNPNYTKAQEGLLVDEGADITKKSEKISINDDGWSIPDLRSAKINETTEIQFKDRFGNERKVKVIHFSLNDKTKKEPYSLTTFNFGKMQLFSVRQWKIGNKIFAYIITARRVEYEQSEKKYMPNGMAFMFGFLDEDGDGKFETLLSDPDSDLSIPQWVL